MAADRRSAGGGEPVAVDQRVNHGIVHGTDALACQHGVVDVGRTGHQRSCTPRLELSPAGLRDLTAMAALHADERVWRHFPPGRHADVEQTRAYLIDREREWRRDGLGYWVARLRGPVGGRRAEEAAASVAALFLPVRIGGTSTFG